MNSSSGSSTSTSTSKPIVKTQLASPSARTNSHAPFDSNTMAVAPYNPPSTLFPDFNLPFTPGDSSNSLWDFDSTDIGGIPFVSGSQLEGQHSVSKSSHSNGLASTVENVSASNQIPNPIAKNNPFLNKLRSMVDDPSTNDLICWSKDGETFLVPHHVKFGDEVLPRFFKHNRFSSFVRQLNMYGFHKVPHLQQGALKSDTGQESELWEFKNDNFKRDRPDLLLNMQRKKGVRSEEEEVKGKGRELSRDGTAPLNDVTGALMRHRNDGEVSIMQLASVWSAIQSIQSAQQGINDNLRHLHNTNNDLFREAAEQRSRSQKQEETINKMLRFLAGVFGAQDIGGGKGATQGSKSANKATDGRRRRVVVRPAFSKNKNGVLMIENSTQVQEGDDQIEELEVPMDEEEGGEEEGIANIEELPNASRSNSNSPKGGTTPQGRFSSINSPVNGVQSLPDISSDANTFSGGGGGGKRISQQAGSQLINALASGDGNAWLASLFGQQNQNHNQNHNHNHNHNQHNQHNQQPHSINHTHNVPSTIDKSSSSSSTGGNIKLDAQTLATLQSVLGNMANNLPENQLARNYQNLQGSTQDAAMVQNALNSLLEGLRMENGVVPSAPETTSYHSGPEAGLFTPNLTTSTATAGNDADIDVLLKEFLESNASNGSSSALTPTAIHNAFVNEDNDDGQIPSFAFSPNGNEAQDVIRNENDTIEDRRSFSDTNADHNSITNSTSRATSPLQPSRKRKPAAFENALGVEDGKEDAVKAVKRANVS